MFPVVELGGTSVGVYGVLVTLGYAVGVIWLMRQLRHLHVTPGEFWTLSYTLLLGALAGGRLGYALVEWEEVSADLLGFALDWRQGWVFWTGLYGALGAGWIFQRFYNRLYRPRRYLPVADYFISALPMGHWLGRVGCFAEGCCHGRPTELPWGARFSHPACSVDPSLWGVPLHPVQLYEAAGELALAVLLARLVLPGIRRGTFVHGTALAVYLGAYSLLRFLGEFLRGDDRGSFLWPLMSPSQWLSFVGLGLAAALVARNGILGRGRPASLHGEGF